MERLATYIGILAVLSGATVFIKVARIIMFEYLFLSHRRVAVPLLLVNLFTLLLSVLLSAWFATDVLNIKLAPLLATSALFSLVLGLALQDTLGNLFAGVSLQFDKPYEIGDWIEVHGPGQKWVGQVYEISWRATVLLGLSEESITVPNRIMGQSQISNFSAKHRPIIRSQTFRFPFDAPEAKIKDALVNSVLSVPQVRKNPNPMAILIETTESWISYRLVYFIDDYGSQYTIGDQVISAALEALGKADVALASSRIHVVRE
jgi:small-conductance mechanosensitive channel